MVNLLLRLVKPIYFIIGMMLLVMLIACSKTDEVSVSDIQQTQTETVVPEESQTMTLEPPTFEDYKDYINYISGIPAFEPYYKTVFAFEEVSGGITNVPIDEVKAMYEEMKSTFDYIHVAEYPLIYRGYYGRNTSFVDGYDQNQTSNAEMVTSNLINVVKQDREGNEILTTPLKTVLLSESIVDRFDDSIDEGRNLRTSDFTLTAPSEPISVVLGSAYKDIYELGDTFSLEMISEVMNFQVVGFYKAGVGFSNDVGAFHHVNFDHTIVMPHFIPEYEPVGEAAVFQHAFHLGELLSGYIRIPESIDKINDVTYDHTVDLMEEIAERNNLSGHYKIANWPVGFVW